MARVVESGNRPRLGFAGVSTKYSEFQTDCPKMYYWTLKVANQIHRRAGFSVFGLVDLNQPIQSAKTCNSDWLVSKFNIAFSDNQPEIYFTINLIPNPDVKHWAEPQNEAIDDAAQYLALISYTEPKMSSLSSSIRGLTAIILICSWTFTSCYREGGTSHTLSSRSFWRTDNRTNPSEPMQKTAMMLYSLKKSRY